MLFSLGNSYEVLKLFLKELWQNHHDPYHAIYGIVGVIVLLLIYNRLLNKYQLQETLPEIPTTERVIKSTRNYIESIYVLQQT